jgi:hypothetical protein
VIVPSEEPKRESPGVPEEETESSRLVLCPGRKVSVEGTWVAGRVECLGLDGSEQIWGVISASKKIRRVIFTLLELDPRLESKSGCILCSPRAVGRRPGGHVERGKRR